MTMTIHKRKNRVNRKVFRSNIYHKTRQSSLKARNTGG